MYHIKTDKRSQTSARLICEGLIECMKKKEFAQITITDIQRTSGVGRSTFYRLFDNIADVVSYMCDQQFGMSITNLGVLNKCSTEIIAKEVLSSMMKNEQVITAITKTGRLAILFSSARTSAFAMRNILTEKYDLDSSNFLSDNQVDYFIATFLCTMISCLTVWISHGRTESVDEVYNNMITMARRMERLDLSNAQ